MKRKNKKEIQRQVDGLKKMKSFLPEFSTFGDKNWEKIDAQLGILEGGKVPKENQKNESHHCCR